VEQFVDSDPKQVAVDDGHALERPVLGEAADDVVDLRLVLADAGHEVGSEGIRIDRELGQHLCRLGRLGVRLVEKGKRQLTRLTASSEEGFALLG
jgi:hypothetical protein